MYERANHTDCTLTFIMRDFALMRFVKNKNNMKNNLLISMVIICVFTSCKNNSNQTIIDNKALTINQMNHCYVFTSEKDSIFMEVNSKGNLITGNLIYKFFEKDQNNGTLQGIIKGDTLIANYEFTSEGIKSIREVAFLKKGNNFVEGHGDMTEKNGRMIFKNTHILNFNSNIILKPVQCGK